MLYIDKFPMPSTEALDDLSLALLREERPKMKAEIERLRAENEELKIRLAHANAMGGEVLLD